jgi:hypothetical protein
MAVTCSPSGLWLGAERIAEEDRLARTTASSILSIAASLPRLNVAVRAWQGTGRGDRHWTEAVQWPDVGDIADLRV